MTILENISLAEFTTLAVGGPARWFIETDCGEGALAAFRFARVQGVPYFVLGGGSNLLVSDDGFPGVVVRMAGKELGIRPLERFGMTIVEADAGVEWDAVVRAAVANNAAGIECLAGIPGTMGGGIRMNAGGKFGDIGSIVHSVQVMDGHGNLYIRQKDDLVFEYRTTNISAPFILGATLDMEPEEPERILRKTKEIWMYKRNTQPLNTKNCGCIFKNPRGLSAGALIDQAGLKGMRVGGAEVSDKHANFVIAHSGCKADDVMKLIKLIREKVWEKNEIHLESEVKIWP